MSKVGLTEILHTLEVWHSESNNDYNDGFVKQGYRDKINAVRENLNRKCARTKFEETEQDTVNRGQKVYEKLALFDRLPSDCLICNKPFDKKDKQMATVWKVVVRDEKDKVGLYCPDCWDSALTLSKLQFEMEEE